MTSGLSGSQQSMMTGGHNGTRGSGKHTDDLTMTGLEYKLN